MLRFGQLKKKLGAKWCIKFDLVCILNKKDK